MTCRLGEPVDVDDVLGVLGVDPVVPVVLRVLGVVVKDKINEEDDVLVVNGRCATPDDNAFQAHKDVMQFLSLEPSAWCAFRACEQTVLHRCVL